MATLPHAGDAVIPRTKIRDYLLSPIHPIGRYKAAFFRRHGYAQSDWSVLAADICRMLACEATWVECTKFGDKYTIVGTVTGPDGRRFGLCTAWIILSDESIPRFVTAYPEA